MFIRFFPVSNTTFSCTKQCVPVIHVSTACTSHEKQENIYVESSSKNDNTKHVL